MNCEIIYAYIIIDSSNDSKTVYLINQEDKQTQF